VDAAEANELLAQFEDDTAAPLVAPAAPAASVAPTQRTAPPIGSD
jgi:hypothetical protein